MSVTVAIAALGCLLVGLIGGVFQGSAGRSFTRIGAPIALGVVLLVRGTEPTLNYVRYAGLALSGLFLLVHVRALPWAVAQRMRAEWMLIGLYVAAITFEILIPHSPIWQLRLGRLELTLLIAVFVVGFGRIALMSARVIRQKQKAA